MKKYREYNKDFELNFIAGYKNHKLGDFKITTDGKNLTVIFNTSVNGKYKNFDITDKIINQETADKSFKRFCKFTNNFNKFLAVTTKESSYISKIRFFDNFFKNEIIEDKEYLTYINKVYKKHIEKCNKKFNQNLYQTLYCMFLYLYDRKMEEIYYNGKNTIDKNGIYNILNNYDNLNMVKKEFEEDIKNNLKLTKTVK